MGGAGGQRHTVCSCFIVTLVSIHRTAAKHMAVLWVNMHAITRVREQGC